MQPGTSPSSANRAFLRVLSLKNHTAKRGICGFRRREKARQLATVPTDSLNKKQQLLNSLGSTKHDPHPLSDLVDELPFTRVVACVSQKVAAGGASLGIPGVVE